VNNKNPQNILIIRTDRIGDVILSIPLAEIIKKHYPNCKVSFFVNEYTKDLLLNHPYIDQTITIIEGKSGFKIFDNVELLRKYDFDVALVLYPTFKISLISFLSGIKKRIGTGYRLYSFLFTDKIYEHRKKSLKHEIEYNFTLLKSIGIDFNAGINNVKFNLNVSENALSKIEKLLIDKGISNDEKIIIIHPGSGGSAVDLPIEKFKEIVKLINETDIKILITGNKSETYICKELILNENVFDFSGLLTLEELVALISKSTLLIANSTGPLHIAAALGKYVFGFYPKIKSCSVNRWGPYTEKKFIYEPELDCNNCNRKQCEELNCMNYINIKKVIDDIKKLLSNKLENPNVK